MPNDPIFENSPANDSAGSGNPTGGGQTDGATADGAGAGLTPETIGQIVADAVKPITDKVSGMEGFFTELQQRAAQQDNQANNDAGQSAPAAAVDFFTDPESAVREVFRQEAGPLVQQLGSTTGDTVLAEEQASIVETFGQNAWDSVFSPVLTPVINNVKAQNPAQLLDRTALKNAIKTITGDNFATLREAQDAVAKERDEAGMKQADTIANLVIQRTNPSGGIRRVQGDKPVKLDGPEYQEYIEGFFKETGNKPDIDRLSALATTGVETPAGRVTTLEQWQSANKEATK
jgi:hypothetical protein